MIVILLCHCPGQGSDSQENTLGKVRRDLLLPALSASLLVSLNTELPVPLCSVSPGSAWETEIIGANRGQPLASPTSPPLVAASSPHSVIQALHCILRWQAERKPKLTHVSEP